MQLWTRPARGDPSPRAAGSDRAIESIDAGKEQLTLIGAIDPHRPQARHAKSIADEADTGPIGREPWLDIATHRSQTLDFGTNDVIELVGNTTDWNIAAIYKGSALLAAKETRWLELDVNYVSRKSIALDTWLLIKTVPAVIFARGSY